ncbi:MAG: hypothetical protein ACFE7R_02390 [Candidatus Hodarchaeota archaeon]
MMFEEDSEFEDALEDDDDFEDDFEDEDFEDDEDFDEEEIEADFARETREPSERWSDFLADPWPRVVFALLIIGFVIILLTPYPIWYEWNYFLIGLYFLVILTAAASVFSLQTGMKAETHRIYYAGILCVIIALAGGTIGVVDTLSWVGFGQSVFPGLVTPILSLSSVVVIFAVYTLWLLTRTFSEKK